VANLWVQHCVLSRATRHYGAVPQSYDLLGVNYFHTVAAGLEFPRPAGPLDLFVRYLARDLPPRRIRLTIRHLRTARAVYDRLVWVSSVAQPGFVVIDQTYKLVGLTFPMDGRYVVRLRHRTRPDYGQPRRWVTLASEPFSVLRSP
jgi:hypothetical protein